MLAGMDQPRTRRRWFQFRLRTLLVAVVVVSLPLSWFAVRMERARKQREAVEWVEANGGSVTYDYELKGVFSSISDYASERGMLADLLGDDYSQDVIVVSLRGAEIDRLSPRSGMPELKDLILFGTVVADDEIRRFHETHPDCRILR